MKTLYGLHDGRHFLTMTDGRRFETSDLDKAERARERVMEMGLVGIEIRPLPLGTRPAK